MATDFQLKVGLDTTKATIDQVNNDIDTIAKAVKPVKLKTTLGMKKEDFQNLLDAKAKKWKHPPQLKTSIVLDSNQDVAKDVSTKLSSLKKLPTIALSIDSTETSQNIGESLNKLTLPTIKVRADLDPTSISTITKTLSSRLQLSVNLNGGRKNDVHGTGSTANQIPRSVAAKRTSVQNDLDSLLAKFGNLQGVSRATTKYVSKMANEINTLLGQTKRVDDFEEIETKLRRMQGLFEKLFKRTELGSGVNELLRDYTSLEQILKRQGLEFTHLGERITVIRSDLERLGKADNLQLLDVDDIARIVSAHDALKDFKQEVDLASQAAQQFNFERAQNQILSLSNRLDKLGAVSGQARSQVRDLSTLLSKMDDLKGATSFTTEDLQRIKEFNNALAHTTALVKNRELANASAKMHGGGFDLQSSSKSTLREVDALEAKLAKTSNVTNSWVRSLEQNLQSLRTSIRSASTAADFDTIDNELRQVADSIDLITSRSNDIGEFKTVLNAYSKLADDIHAANAEQSFLGQTILSYYDVLQKVIASSQNLDLIPGNELQEARDARDLIEDISRMMKQSFAGHSTSKTYAPLTYNETAENIKKDMEALRKIGRLDSDAFRGLQQALDDLEKLKHLDRIEVVTAEQAETVNMFRASLSALGIQVKELKRLSGAEFFDTALIARFEDAKNDLKVFASENSKVLTDANFLAEFQRLSDATYWDFGGTKEGITRLTMEVERFKAEAKQAGLATKTFADELKLLVTSISLSNLISRVGNYADEVFRSVVENVRALDTAMVELKKVTDETSMAYASFYQNAKHQAQEVGATLSDTIQSTADFARLGYTLEESVELSKVSTIYKNVGDGFESVTESSEALISIIKAFNIEAKDAIQIADKLNKIGNENAISSGGLGRALQNSASALSEAGASMEEAMALISGANSVTQDPDKVGNAMRTIALRIRSTATELEEMGEDAIGAAESTSKLREKIFALSGVDIMIDANNYKGIYQILQEIARVWEDISDVDQAALLELLAGKNRANVLAGLLSNFADADEALKDALNADGSALAENEKILNSIQGKINQFQAAWQGLSETVMNSEFLKSIIDQGTNVLKILDRLIDSAGMLSTTMAMIGGIGAYAFFDSLPQDMNASSWFKQGAGSLLENLKTELSLNDALKTQRMQAKALDALNNDSARLRSFYNEVSKTYSGASIEVTSQAADNLKGMSDAALELANRIATNKMNQEEFNKRLDEFNNKGKVGISNLKGMTIASKAASVGLNILASAAVSVGVAIASMLIQKAITYLQDATLNTNEAREAFENLREEANQAIDQKGTVSSLASELTNLKNKSKLSADEVERYYEIQNQLKDLLPNLAGYYNAQGNFIITEQTNVTALTQAYSKLIVEKRRATEEAYREKTWWGFGKSTYENDIVKTNIAKDAISDLDEYINYKRNGVIPTWAKDYDSYELSAALSDLEYTYDINSLEDAITKQKEYNQTLQYFANNIASHAQNAILSLDEYLTDGLNLDSANLVLNSVDLEQRQLWYDALMSDNANAIVRVLSEIKATDVYKESSSGDYDGMTEAAKKAVADLGGLENANAAVKEYEENQRAVIAGTHEWKNESAAANVAAVKAYKEWLDAQNESSKAEKGLSLEESQKGIIKDMKTLEESVKSLGEAYGEFAKDGEISASTLASLSETFSGCGDEWTDFVSLVGSGDMTLSQLDSSLENLISKFAKQQALTGDVTEETKDLLVEMLESIGVTNAEEVAITALGEAFAKTTAEKIAAANPDFYNMSAEEITKLLNEEGATLDVAQALFNLYLAKIQASNGGFLSITKQETAALESLSIAAGNAATVAPIIGRLNAAIDEYNGLLEEQAGGGNVTNTMLQEATNKIYAERDALVEVQRTSNDTTNKMEMDFNKMSDAAKDAADKMEEAFQEAYDELQFMREANLISEEKYLAQLLALNEKYNRNNLQTYRKYALEIFNTLKSMITDQINDQADAEIKALENKREQTEKYYDEQIKALEQQREAQEEYYDELIKAEQERLDQLKDEWDVQDHLLKIEQARAALKQAEQQKNVHLYKEGEGFVWEANQEEIGSAQDALNEAIKDYERYIEEKEIQDRIDMLEDAKEDVLDMIDEQIEHLEEAKEQALEIIDEQIEAIEEWRDAALKALEDMEMATDDFLKFFKEFGLEMTAEIQGIIDMLDAMAAAAMNAAAAMASVGSVGSENPKSKNKNNKSTTTKNDNAGIVWDDKRQSHRWEATIEPDGDRYVDVIAPDGTIISKRYAEGTLSVPTTGMALTDEEGPEIRIPGKGTFRKLHYGDAVLPADISRNLWMIGAKPVSFAKGIANMITNKNDDKRQNVFHFGDIHLPNVQNAQNFADEFKDIVMKATQLVYSK